MTAWLVTDELMTGPAPVAADPVPRPGLATPGLQCSRGRDPVDLAGL